MSHQNEDKAGRGWNVLVKNVLQRGVDGLGRKPRADKTWVHLRTYFKDRWTATMHYQVDNPHKHEFESDAIKEEDRGKQEGRIATNLRDVSVSATADKEYI